VDAEAIFLAIQQVLSGTYPCSGWWPSESPDEIMVGAVLTQGTAWTAVEMALANLRNGGYRTLSDLSALEVPELEALVRPAGCFVRKTRTLKALSWLAGDNGGDLAGFLKARDRLAGRNLLLSIPGIGPETADAILLYAASHPVFVVDAYARRIMTRHGIPQADLPYDAFQAWVEVQCGPDSGLFHALHAGIVEIGKTCCRKRKPRCGECPLGHLLSGRAKQRIMADA